MSSHESLNSKNFNKLVADIKKVGREVIAPNAHDVDEKARFPTENFEALKDLKLLSAYLPENMGGMGLNIVQIAKIC